MTKFTQIAIIASYLIVSINVSANDQIDTNISDLSKGISESSGSADKAHDKLCKKLARKAVWRGIGAAMGIGVLATVDKSVAATWSTQTSDKSHMHKTDGSITYNETYGQRHDEALINGSMQVANAIQTEGEFELAGSSRAYLYPKSMQSSIREREALEAKSALN